MKKSPITVFSEWAQNGRDEGMESNHAEAVANMITYATKECAPFDFIDVGCGNGWVVRKVAALPHCKRALGVDGAKAMIAKAQSLDDQNRYACADIMEWQPESRVDLIHSMEVFYYVNNPQALIQNIYDHWLRDQGRLIIGLDFYFENKVSHSWPEDCGISGMQLFPINRWVSFFEEAGFRDVSFWQVGAKAEWAGTLVVTGLR